jgi:hypothetical protein
LDFIPGRIYSELLVVSPKDATDETAGRDSKLLRLTLVSGSDSVAFRLGVDAVALAVSTNPRWQQGD